MRKEGYMELKQNQLEQVQKKLVLKKAKDLQEGEIEAILSTDDLDRHGEHVSIKGLVIPKDQVIKMYYNHETYGKAMPIGKWNRIWKSNGKLMGRGQFDMNDPFAVMVYQKVLNGFIDSISIGFYPQEYDGEDSTWTKSTLVEASVVAEPANVAAVITSKDLGFTKEEFAKALVVRLKKDMNTGFPAEDGTPPQEVVEDPATYGLKTPEPIEPDAADPPEEVTPPVVEDEDDSSEDGATELTEIKAAIEDLNSKYGSLEAAFEAASENPAKKNLIKVRLAAKQVDKATEALNVSLRVKLKETQ